MLYKKIIMLNKVELNNQEYLQTTVYKYMLDEIWII